MQSYWVKIGTRAFLVFGVGMLVWQGVRSANSTVRKIRESFEPITIPLGFVPFKVDGVRLGTVRTLNLLRDETQHVTSVRLNVRLGDRADAARLPDCDLYLANTTQLDERSSFSCVPQELVASGAVQKAGSIRLTPTDRSIAVWGDSAAVNELLRSKIGASTASESAQASSGSAAAGADDFSSMDSSTPLLSVSGAGNETVRMASDADGLRMSVVGADGERVQIDIAGPGGIKIDVRGNEKVSRLAHSYVDTKLSAEAARGRGDQAAAARAESRASAVLREMRTFTPAQYDQAIQIIRREAGEEAVLPVSLARSKAAADSTP